MYNKINDRMKQVGRIERCQLPLLGKTLKSQQTAKLPSATATKKGWKLPKRYPVSKDKKESQQDSNRM